MAIVSRKCPNCGASLPRAGEALHVTCEYCQYEWDVEPPAPPPPPPRPQMMPMPTETPRIVVRLDSAPARRVVKGVGCFVIALPIFIMMLVGGILWSTFSSVGMAPSLPGFGGAGGIGGPRMTWQKTIGFVQVNGDAIEDILLQVRFSDQEDSIHLGVFDGASMSTIWTAGPFGTYTQGYQYTHTAVVGNRVVVTDFRGQAHLYDLASGTQVSQVPLPDRAKRVCVPPAGASQVWVEADNGQNVVLDVATGASQPAAAPPWGPCAESMGLEAPKPPPQALSVTLAGFQSEEVLTDGSAVVATGLRASGIRVPMVVGMSPDGRTPAWTLVVPTVDEGLVVSDTSHPTRYRLAAGRLFVAYSLSNDTGRLAAIDARTGTRLWESELPSCCAHGVDVDEIHVGPNRVMTEQFLQVEVFDVQTGRLIGRVTPW